MDIDVKSWLFDILNAISEIDSFFVDVPHECVKQHRTL